MRHVTGGERSGLEIEDDIAHFKSTFSEALSDTKQSQSLQWRIKEKEKAYITRLKREEDENNMYKFGKLSTKTPFVSQMKPQSFFHKQRNTVQLHEKYRDYREREKLIFPNKVSQNLNKFSLVRTVERNYFGQIPLQKLSQKARSRVEFYEKQKTELKLLETADYVNSLDGRFKKQTLSCTAADNILWKKNSSDLGINKNNVLFFKTFFHIHLDLTMEL